MAATGFTPIQLYYSTTTSNAPVAGNLVLGELAINTTDGKLYYKNTAGVVKVIADGATATGNLPGGTAGALVYQSAPSVTTYLTLGSAGSIVYSNGTAPAYASIGAAGSLLYSNGTAPTALAVGTSTYILTSNGTAPVYTNPSSITVGTAALANFATTAGAASTATTATEATNLAGGNSYQIAYQSATGSTSFATAPTGADVGKVLSWNGSSFTWASAPAATSASNIAGGAQYQIPFQSGVGATTFSANLTFNSSTNTVGTTNVTATGAVSGNTVASTTTVTAGTSITATTSVTGATVTANKSISPTATIGAFNYGTLGYTDTNIFGSYQTSVDGYAQQILQNTNSGSSASVDYIVSNDLGTATTYYGNFGMNSSTFAGVGPFQLPNAVYLFSTNSDLVIGTKTAHELRLVTNDNSADSMTINAAGAVAFNGNFGVAGRVLQSNGTGSAPTWIDTASIGTTNGKLYFFGQF